MGTREVYEEKLRRGNLQFDPTINPGLGSARCPRCLSLINPDLEKGEWAINPTLHDATAVAGCGAGAMLSVVHGINTGIPFVQKHVKGPKWLQFLIGAPSLLLYSGASAALGAFVLPRFCQLTVTSYYAASSASLYAISRATKYVEDTHSSRVTKYAEDTHSSKSPRES
ncbi:hypothetical protein Cni_G12851 [Canna indica]|uniref:Gb protein n=1 Tax=Canna indica TaxID=4628 RepID=A0AAQ3KAP4_9LILI|nr:hypothetical protein Cni_G12851 [Canna indica]